MRLEIDLRLQHRKSLDVNAHSLPSYVGSDLKAAESYPAQADTTEVAEAL